MCVRLQEHTLRYDQFLLQAISQPWPEIQQVSLNKGCLETKLLSWWGKNHSLSRRWLEAIIDWMGLFSLGVEGRHSGGVTGVQTERIRVTLMFERCWMMWRPEVNNEHTTSIHLLTLKANVEIKHSWLVHKNGPPPTQNASYSRHASWDWLQGCVWTNTACVCQCVCVCVL